jgi:serine/threonine-protein kinase
VVPRGTPPAPPVPPVPDATRVLDEVVPPPSSYRAAPQPPGYPRQPEYPQQPLYRDEPDYARPQYAAPGQGQYRAPEPPPRVAPPQPPPQHDAPLPPEVEPPRRSVREPREPREPRPPRPRGGFRLTSIPGLGCGMGCLLRLVIMAAVLVAIYYLTPVHHWVDQGLDVFHHLKSWYQKAKDFFDGSGSGNGGGDNPTKLPANLPTGLPHNLPGKSG